MVTQRTPIKMSVEDYFELDNNSLEVRYEFIDGYVYMLAGGTADHSTINGNLVAAFKSALRGGPCRVHTVELISLGISIPVAAIYEDVEFPEVNDL